MRHVWIHAYDHIIIYKNIPTQTLTHMFLHTWAYECASAMAHMTSENNCKVRLFLVPVSPPVRFEGGENCGFFGRAISDHFWSSTAPALLFLAVSRFFCFFCARPFRRAWVDRSQKMLPWTKFCFLANSMTLLLHVKSRVLFWMCHLSMYFLVTFQWAS